MKFLINSLILAILLIFTACSGGSGSSDNSSSGVDTSPQVVKVVIAPQSVLFTDLDQSKMLSATAYDASGNVINKSITWTTSHNDVVTIGADGNASAQGVIGSTTITAEAGGVKSKQVIALVTELAGGAIPITDQQVIGDIALVDPTTPLRIGSQYKLTIKDVNLPQSGDIMVGTGELPIGGQVVSAVQNGKYIDVVLEIIPIDQMFSQLKIDENMTLTAADFTMSDNISNYYDSSAQSDGSLIFNAKAPSLAPSRIDLLNFDLGPFSCKTDASINFLTLSIPETIQLTPHMSRIISYNGGLQKASLLGSLSSEFKIGINLTSSLDASFICTSEIARVDFNLAGPFYLAIPLGIGFDLKGQVQLAQLGVEESFKIDQTMELGIGCDSAECHSIRDYTIQTGSLETKYTIPSLNVANNIHLKPEITAYTYGQFLAGIDLFIVKKEGELIQSKLGIVAAGDFGNVPGQIEDTSYSSEYKLSTYAMLQPGEDLDQLPIFSILPFVPPIQEQITTDLATSPKALSATANQDQYNYGDAVTFKVKLDQATVNYGFLGYNVDEISIYKRVPNAEGSYDYIHFFDMHATDGQTKFEREWVFTDEGNITDNYYAFVKTKFLPTFGEFGILEVAKIDPMEDYTVTSVCTTDGATPQTVSSTYVDGRLSIQGSTQYTYNDITPEHYIVTATSSSGTVTTQEVNTSLPVIKPIRSRYLYNAPLQSYFYHLDHHPVPHYLLSDFYGNFYEYTNGRVTERRPNGDVFIRNYDSNYNVTSYIENRNNGTQRTTTYTYDSNGFISGCVDGNYNTTATTNYNNEDGKVNSLTQRTVYSDSGGFDYAETYTGNYNYDSHGNLTSEYIYYQEDESGDNDFTGSHTIAYTYDNLDNILHIMHNYYGDYEVFGEYTYGYTVEETYSFEANTKHLMHSDKTTTRPANIPGYPDAREVVTETSCDYTDTRW